MRGSHCRLGFSQSRHDGVGLQAHRVGQVRLVACRQAGGLHGAAQGSYRRSGVIQQGNGKTCVVGQAFIRDAAGKALLLHSHDSPAYLGSFDGIFTRQPRGIVLQDLVALGRGQIGEQGDGRLAYAHENARADGLGEALGRVGALLHFQAQREIAVRYEQKERITEQLRQAHQRRSGQLAYATGIACLGAQREQLVAQKIMSPHAWRTNEAIGFHGFEQTVERRATEVCVGAELVDAGTACAACRDGLQDFEGTVERLGALHAASLRFRFQYFAMGHVYISLVQARSRPGEKIGPGRTAVSPRLGNSR